MGRRYIKATHPTVAKTRKKHKLSEAGRLAISRAAKARWAKQNAAKKKPTKTKVAKAAKPALVKKVA